MEHQNCAPSVTEQRLAHSLNLGPFLDQIEGILDNNVSDSETDTYSDESGEELEINREDKRNLRESMYNFSSVKEDRLWLKEILLSSDDSSDSERELNDSDLKRMIQEHKLRKKYQSQFYQDEKSQEYMYYSAGLLSKQDKFSEENKSLPVQKRFKQKIKTIIKEEPQVEANTDFQPLQILNTIKTEPHSDDSIDFVVNFQLKQPRRDRRRKTNVQMLNTQRRKLWIQMAKKEVGKIYKSRLASRKEVFQACKKMAHGCMKVYKQRAVLNQKILKDKMTILKKINKNTHLQNDPYHSDIKEISNELDENGFVENLELKGREREFNFFLTVADLYSYFITNEMISEGRSTVDRILSQLDENFEHDSSFYEDSSSLKQKALELAHSSFQSYISRVNTFNMDTGGKREVVIPEEPPYKPGRKTNKNQKSRSLFVGDLMPGELIKIKWVSTLHNSGINTLCSKENNKSKLLSSKESNRRKLFQIAAFLSHITEEFDKWGPYLIILSEPESELKNSACEISKSIPSLKILSYFNSRNPEAIKNMQKLFESKLVGSKEAPFHVVVTSYSVAEDDVKILKLIKWNFIVFDDFLELIEDIPNTELFTLDCRSQLMLLTGELTNDADKLFFLLCFVMPTLFDSKLSFEYVKSLVMMHKYSNRLRNIVERFFWAEDSEPSSVIIETFVPCSLTKHQTNLYENLRDKVLSRNPGPVSHFSLSHLTDFVEKFRKICNHPEILDERHVQSSHIITPEPYTIPKLILNEFFVDLLDPEIASVNLQIQNFDRNKCIDRFSIFDPLYIWSSFKDRPRGKENISKVFKNSRENNLSSFSFMKFLDLSIGEFSQVVTQNCLTNFILEHFQKILKLYLNNLWKRQEKQSCDKKSDIYKLKYLSKDAFILNSSISLPCVQTSSVLSDLIFTRPLSNFYTFSDHKIQRIPKIMQSYNFSDHKAYSISEKRQSCTFSQLKKANINRQKIAPNILRTHSNRPKIEEIKLDIDNSSTFSTNTLPNINRLSNIFPNFNKSSNFLAKNLPNLNKTSNFPTCNLSYTEKTPNFGRNNLCICRPCQPTFMPIILSEIPNKVRCLRRENFPFDSFRDLRNVDVVSKQILSQFKPELAKNDRDIIIPDTFSSLMNSGKIRVLNALLNRLKDEKRQILVFSRMIQMIDLFEDFFDLQNHNYVKLDLSDICGTNKAAENAERTEKICVFILSPMSFNHSANMKKNLINIDTVIFYDSDLDTTLDRQILDCVVDYSSKRVAVYRLFCSGTIEDKFLQKLENKNADEKTPTVSLHDLFDLEFDEDARKLHSKSEGEKYVVENKQKTTPEAAVEDSLKQIRKSGRKRKRGRVELWENYIMTKNIAPTTTAPDIESPDLKGAIDEMNKSIQVEVQGASTSQQPMAGKQNISKDSSSQYQRLRNRKRRPGRPRGSLLRKSSINIWND